MKEACPLKVREYLANGLPVYAGHKDVFPSTFEYFRFGLPRMDHILDYARTVVSFPQHQVREAASDFIDKRILLRQLSDQLAGL